MKMCTIKYIGKLKICHWCMFDLKQDIGNSLEQFRHGRSHGILKPLSLVSRHSIPRLSRPKVMIVDRIHIMICDCWHLISECVGKQVGG
jgi:hypothetical protein